eukprot:g199.t1
MSSFEEAKQFLKANPDANGNSLYDHLSETLLKVLTDKPANALDAFEDISAGVKRAAFAGGAVENAGGGAAAAAAARAAQMEWVEATTALTLGAGGDEDAGPPEDPEGLQDLPDEAALLEAAGAGFGREETARLHAALRKLGADAGATNVRLWGRISGTEGDYVIAEGEAEPAEGDDAEPSADLEGKEGANKYTYWACSWVGGAWTRLPNVKASQVTCHAQHRKLLTGRLDAPVTGYPPFPGNESNLLRAAIARISSATVLVPAGLYEAEDEEENPAALTAAEEPAPAEDLADAGAWSHFHLQLDKNYGRCRKWEDPDAGEDEDGGGDEDAAEFAVRGPLASCGDDEEGAWGVRSINGGKVAVLRSREWPGAVSVGYGARFANLYVGYGVEWSAAPYQPRLPPALRAEYTIGEDVAEEDTAARLVEAEDVITEPAKPEEEEDEDE